MPLVLCCSQRRRNVSWPPFLHITVVPQQQQTPCTPSVIIPSCSKDGLSVRLGGEEPGEPGRNALSAGHEPQTRGWEEKGDKWEERIFARVLALAPFAALKLNPEESRFPVSRQRFTLGLESMPRKKTSAGFTEFTGNEAIDVCCTLRRGGVRTRT